MVFMPQDISIFDLLKNGKNRSGGGSFQENYFSTYLSRYHFRGKFTWCLAGVCEREEKKIGCARIRIAIEGQRLGVAQ
jgi:hypothetical protein